MFKIYKRAMGINTISVISVNEFSPKLGVPEPLEMKRENSSVKNTSYWNLLRVFGILTGCALVLFSQTLIPRHNSIVFQEYWFEINLPVSIVMLVATAGRILEAYIFTKCKQLISIRVFSKM